MKNKKFIKIAVVIDEESRLIIGTLRVSGRVDVFYSIVEELSTVTL